MNTREAATAIGTEPKVLRRFLRDASSTYTAVGSGSRYDFTDADIPELARRFAAWSGTKPARPAVVRSNSPSVQRRRDEQVWAEEGPVILDDIRRPDVRARVQRIAAERAARLDERLMAAGLHISQYRDRMAAAS